MPAFVPKKCRLPDDGYERFFKGEIPLYSNSSIAQFSFIEPQLKSSIWINFVYYINI
jgi:hypothetical protein